MASLLDALPPEIIYYCFSNIFEVHHIVAASQVCKDWYRLSRQPKIWQSFVGEWFGPVFVAEVSATTAAAEHGESSSSSGDGDGDGIDYGGGGVTATAEVDVAQTLQGGPLPPTCAETATQAPDAPSHSSSQPQQVQEQQRQKEDDYNKESSTATTPNATTTTDGDADGDAQTPTSPSPSLSRAESSSSILSAPTRLNCSSAIIAAGLAAQNLFKSKYRIWKKYQSAIRQADEHYDAIVDVPKFAPTWIGVPLDARLSVRVWKRKAFLVNGAPRIALHSQAIIKAPFDLAVSLLREARHREKWDIVLANAWSIMHVDQHTDITLLRYQSFDCVLLRHHRVMRSDATTTPSAAPGGAGGGDSVPQQQQNSAAAGSGAAAAREYRQSEHSVNYTRMLRHSVINHPENEWHIDVVGGGGAAGNNNPGPAAGANPDNNNNNNAGDNSDSDNDNEDVEAEGDGDGNGDGEALVHVWGSGFFLREIDATHCLMGYSVQIIPDPTQALHANVILDNLCRNRPICIRRFEVYVRQYQQLHGADGGCATASTTRGTPAPPPAVAPAAVLPVFDDNDSDDEDDDSDADV